MINYNKLFAMMDKRGLKKYWLRQNGINPKVVNALKNNANVNMSTINQLCKIIGLSAGGYPRICTR